MMDNFWDNKLICRICLKVLGTSGFKYVGEENLKEMIIYSVPEVDIYASADPVICSQCHCMLVNVYNFKKKCINTEVILRTYQTRHHIDEDSQVDLTKLIEELVRFNSYFHHQEFNKSLSVPFPPPDGTMIAQPEMTDFTYAVDSNIGKGENLTIPRCTEYDTPQFIDPNTLSHAFLPQRSAPAQMELRQFDDRQFARTVETLTDDPMVVPPIVQNVPENMSDSNKCLMQNFPTHFMASSASNQLMNLNQHHLVNSKHNHATTPFVAVTMNRLVNVNHNQFPNMAHSQLINGNQAQGNVPVCFLGANPNNVMTPLMVSQTPGNVPLENFRFVPVSSFNRPMAPVYNSNGGDHNGPTLNMNAFAKNVIVREPAVSKASRKPREKVTEQRVTEGMKLLKVVLKRKIETHSIESKRRLVVELERCKLMPSDVQNGKEGSSESQQKLFQCVGCMYMTTSSKFFTEHMKNCAHATKENHNKIIESKCTKCPYVTFNQKEFEEHVETSHSPTQELISCNNCKFVTRDKTLLDRHQAVDRIKCSKCTQMFCSDENLQKHMEKHQKNTCPFCAYSPADRSNFRRHILAHSPVQIPCEFCDYRHSSPYMLRAHLRKYHNSVGIEDLDYKPHISLDDLIKEVKTLIDATN